MSHRHNKPALKALLFGLLIIMPGANLRAAMDARQEVVSLMEKAGMQDLLSAPVYVQTSAEGMLVVLDDGLFIVQQMILPYENVPEPNIVIDKSVAILPSVDKLVIVTHGWLDKGQYRWPNDIAEAFGKRVDPNEWLCGSFDWKGGSAVISSIYAAEYARDVAGPRLAAAVIKLDKSWRHIHLIGHSAGAWAIQSAALNLAKTYPDTVFHLTFLDAYVPSRWDPSLLGKIFEDPHKQSSLCWAEHYYTKDLTLSVTEHDLKWAHNVDISMLDPLICEHEFPYRWYKATITGAYDRWDEKPYLVQSLYGSVDYGFARSLESAPENWKTSLNLPISNKALVFHRPKQ